MQGKIITRFIIPLIVSLTINACTGEVTAPLPTRAILPTASVTATATVTASPTHTPTATETITATYTATPSPTSTAAQVTESANFIPAITPTPLPAAFAFGRSGNGANLLAYRYGTGANIIMLVGGIHAGAELNTIDLMQEMRDYFAANPDDIHPSISLIIVPALNPDGQAFGRQTRGRFNGAGVDLNRNWGCGWEEEAVFAMGTVSPGEEAFSEPETAALGSLIQQTRPRAVIFYHAAANGVFAGNCGEPVSDELGEIYGTASGYPFGDSFGDYSVTGTAPGWVNSQGIPSVDVELATASDTEFVRNLRAIMAVQNWIAGD